MNRFLQLLLQVGLPGLLILAHQNAQANNSVDGAVSARHLRSSNKVAASPHSLTRNLKKEKDDKEDKKEEKEKGEKKDGDNEEEEDNSSNRGTRDEPQAGTRIVGGEKVDKLENYEYFAHLNGCGGSKISKRCLLTAAHCVGNKKPNKATFGKLNKSDDGTVVKIKDWEVHPNYNPSKTDFDFAIICAKDVIEMNGSEVKSIKIDDGTNTKAGRDAFALGMGWTDYEKQTTSDSLRIVDLEITTDEKCKDEMGSSRITPQMICASLPGKDACIGDSGGPLVDKQSKKLVGLTSWGIGCAIDKYEGVYAKVSSVNHWIDDTIAKYGGYGNEDEEEEQEEEEQEEEEQEEEEQEEEEQEGGNTTGDVTKFNSCTQAYDKITAFNDCTRDLEDRETQKNNACQPNSNCVKQFKKAFKKVCKKCDKNYSKCASECDKWGFCDL